jgi:hypothetical protein
MGNAASTAASTVVNAASTMIEMKSMNNEPV